MTDATLRKRLAQLADAIAEIAARSWADLGTEASQRIQREMQKLADDLGEDR